MSRKVYCLGKNTGCGHEDKPTLKECSDCPYMTTIKPMSEQELLLSELMAICKEKEEDLVGVETDIWLQRKLERIIAKVKQHYEQKQLESDALAKKLLNEIIRLAGQSFIPPIDLIARARAELADLEARRLK